MSGRGPLIAPPKAPPSGDATTPRTRLSRRGRIRYRLIGPSRLRGPARTLDDRRQFRSTPCRDGQVAEVVGTVLSALARTAPPSAGPSSPGFGSWPASVSRLTPGRVFHTAPSFAIPLRRHHAVSLADRCLTCSKSADRGKTCPLRSSVRVRSIGVTLTESKAPVCRNTTLLGRGE